MNTYDLSLDAQRDLLHEKLQAQRQLIAERFQPTFTTADGQPRSIILRRWLGTRSRPLAAAVATVRLVAALGTALAAAQMLRSALRPASHVY